MGKLFIVAFLAAGGAAAPLHSASVVVEVDQGAVEVVARAGDNLSQVAASFCHDHGIAHPRCAHLVAIDLFEALWCALGQKDRAQALGAIPPRTFRFLHHEYHSVTPSAACANAPRAGFARPDT